MMLLKTNHASVKGGYGPANHIISFEPKLNKHNKVIYIRNINQVVVFYSNKSQSVSRGLLTVPIHVSLTNLSQQVLPMKSLHATWASSIIE